MAEAQKESCQCLCHKAGGAFCGSCAKNHLRHSTAVPESEVFCVRCEFRLGKHAGYKCEDGDEFMATAVPESAPPDLKIRITTRDHSKPNRYVTAQWPRPSSPESAPPKEEK